MRPDHSHPPMALAALALTSAVVQAQPRPPADDEPLVIAEDPEEPETDRTEEDDGSPQEIAGGGRNDSDGKDTQRQDTKEIAKRKDQPAPRPEDSSENVHHAEWLGAMGMAPIGVLAYGADAGDYNSHFVGVSLLPTTGHIVYTPEDSSLLAEFRWRFHFVEVPLALYRATLGVDVGQRLRLGRGHEIYAKGGLHGTGGTALKWWRANLRFPSAGIGYLWHADDWLVQVGPEAALAMVGAFRVGRAAHLTLDQANTKDYHGVDYSFRPYVAGRVDATLSPVWLSLAGGRTFLAGESDGSRLDEVRGTVCATFAEDSIFAPGGCVYGTVVRGDVP